MIPSSQAAWPLTPWPPPLIANGSPVSRASATAAMTSCVLAARMITRGLRSIIALKSFLASS